VCGIPLFQLPSPCIKGDMIFFQIAKEVYLVGLKECKSHLHRRILLTKENKPLTHLDLCAKLVVSWKNLGQWKAIPLGKGFYEFVFLL